MPARSSQLQIRVTPQQKAALKRRARAAGIGMSEYVLGRALPSGGDRFARLVRALGTAEDPRAVLAEVNDLLASSVAAEFTDTVAAAELGGLSPYLANYLAAMVEQAAHLKQAAVPGWTRDVPPLDVPHFATTLESLRGHLLRASPVPFKRRNIFVDAGVGARV